MDWLMARLQISQTPKPVVNLWFSSDIKPPSANYNFQGENKKLDYINSSVLSLAKHMQNYCNIKIKNIDNNVVQSGPLILNIAPIVCMDADQLKTAIINLKSDFYNLCAERNIQIVLFLFRETILTETAGEIADLIQSHIVNTEYIPKYLRIVHCAYQLPIELIQHKEFIVGVDTFSRILADASKHSDPVLSIDTTQSKTYKFSLLTGALRDRYNRCLFLAKADKLNLLGDFFYSMVLPNYDKDIQSIRDSFADSEYRDIIYEACDRLFYNKMYDVSGDVLLGKTIYDDLIEYKIPPQVLDSYVHVVLETSFTSAFITEKIYKPLMVGLPFVWHGQKDILPYLESQGFRKYAGIDYSFDGHPDPDVRLDLLLQEIQRLKTVDLKQLVEDNKEVSAYNIEQFWEISKNFEDLWSQLK